MYIGALTTCSTFDEQNVTPTFEPHSKSRVYQTWVIFSSSRGFRCLAKDVSTTAVQQQNQGSSIYIVKSENYDQGFYHPRRVQYINIQCPSDGVIQSMTMDLERRTTLTIGTNTTYYCADYVQIAYSGQGKCEICGNETVSNSNCLMYFSYGINITFRSSQWNNYKGFSMNVVCVDPSEQDVPGCIQTLPAWREQSTTHQADSHDYYSIVRKYTRAVNLQLIIIFPFLISDSEACTCKCRRRTHELLQKLRRVSSHSLR